MKEEKVIRAFNASGALNDLKDEGDTFGIGSQLYEQVGDMMYDLAFRGKEWAEACQEDWSALKAGVPWMTGNLSEAIVVEDGFQERGQPYFWVGVDLNALLGPKIRPVTNSIDYPESVGQPIEVASDDYTEAVNKKNRTGPDKFIQNVWWVTADKNLKEAMR